MQIGTRRLNHEGGECFAALGDGQVSGGAHGIGEEPQGRYGRITQQGLNRSTQSEEAKSQSESAICTTPNQRVTFQRDHQAINHRSADIHRGGKFGNSEPIGR
jgi:hypothetical protein